MLITIIKDNKLSANILSKNIKKSGYNTKIVSNCEGFLKNDYNNSDLYIIGNSYKEEYNCDIIKFIRQKKFNNSPIIIISGNYDIKKAIISLDLGADDYLAKPFSSEELIARIRALLRRSYRVTGNSKTIYKNIIYDIKNKTLKKNGNLIEVTPRELKLAEFLLFNVGKMITKEQLINSVWGEYDLSKISDNNINVTISNLRKKLGEDFDFKTLINKGYILEK